MVSYNSINNCNNDIYIIPKINELTSENIKNIKINNLRKICKYYNIKNFSKLKKEELIYVINEFYNKEKYAIIIQKNWRKYLVQKFLNMKSPNKTWLPNERKKLCKNSSDFYTMDNVESIPIMQYICYIDENDCYWGFDILSIYNYYKHHIKITKNSKTLNNPYTSIPFSSDFIELLLNHINYSKILGFHINIEINNEVLTDDKSNKELLMDILYILEQHGYPLRIEWFDDFNTHKIIKFLLELNDIWNYRTQISYETKTNICYPSGNPFGIIHSIRELASYDYTYVLKKALEIINNMISKGITYSDCDTGILFVLSGLTLVSENIANAYPWIYEGSFY